MRKPGLLKTTALAGLTVFLAFSIIAGVDLFASCTRAVTLSLLGGRPAMITTVTGAIQDRYRSHDTGVRIGGLNGASVLMCERVGEMLGSGH